MREVREREVTGESESEEERVCDIFYLNDCGAHLSLKVQPVRPVVLTDQTGPS